MTNYREILRLDSLGLNKTQIADACDCSRTTVIAVLRRAEEVGLVTLYLKAFQTKNCL